jgi:serine-aspartate repeat-containing protein C/D/E
MATTPTEIDVPVGAGMQVAQQDFGAAVVPVVSGRVFHDPHGNGTDELPLKGWTVYLDANNNGRLDRGEVKTLTSTNGRYAFTQLRPGVTYHVHVVVPRGWVALTPQRLDVTAVTGESAAGNDFGMAQRASISGSVFNDANNDGRKGPGEQGLAGWTVFLDANGNGVRDRGELGVLTDAQGHYAFNGLVPGAYTVRLLVKTGWKGLLPPLGFFTIAVDSGQDIGGMTFSVMRVGSSKDLLSDRQSALEWLGMRS